MGMTRASLDLQIQQETQRAIATLQKNIERLDGICRIIDGNTRQAHMVMYQDIMQLRVRINFLLDELKKTDPEVEERFKEFAAEASKQMEKDVADAIAAREKAQEGLAATQTPPPADSPGSENTPSVIQ